MEQELIYNAASEQLTASFVPAILRRQFAKDPKRKAGTPVGENYAALLWIDICAFSPLCNRIIKDSELGVEKLSRILQEHYEFLLGIIAEHNGEPVTFAGDGLLASWPCSEGNLKYAIESAASCAHAILGRRKTTDDLGNLLSFHVVVSGGPCELIELGGANNQWMFTIAGKALSDISLVAQNRAPDQVLISNTALKYLDSNLARIPANHDSSILIGSPACVNSPVDANEPLKPEAIDALQYYVPKPIGFPLNIERLQWIAELRPVTIVFIQIPIHGLETAEIITSLRQSVILATPIVNMYDGLLNQIWVDEKDANMLVCFGPPPHSHADNPARGIKTALDIHTILNNAGIENGIGVTTGNAYCGIFGNDMLRQYTVIGDVVNLGARFAALKNNQVLCDKSTYNICQDTFEFSSSLEMRIKGNTELVTAWQPVRLLKDNSNNKTTHASIGRKKELSFLLETFDQVASGESKLLLVQGQSGMGKSRLLLDFKVSMNKRGHQVFLETTDIREKDVPYTALRNIFSALLEIDETKNDTTRTKKINRLVEKYGPRACLLNVILPLEIAESAEVKTLPGSQKAMATHNFLLDLLNDAAQKKPIAIIIDDAQWIDEMSAKLIEDIPGKINNSMVIYSLPDAERVPRIQQLVQDGVINITLDELSNDDLNKLICARLGVTEVAENISLPIRKVAKGNPFFSAQLAGSLLDQGMIIVENGKCRFAPNINTDSLSLPETVKGVVRRRIDCLGHGAQLSLKVGSIIGQRFRTHLLQHIYPVQTEKNLVDSYLLEDKQYGLLDETVIDNMDAFVFNHSITREVAYEMTLVEQRKRLHRSSAEWYESNFAENLSPFYTPLAYHWEEAGEKIKASEYYEMEAFRLFSHGYPKQATDVGLKGIALFNINIVLDVAAMGAKIGECMGAIGQLMEGRTIESLLDFKKLEDPFTERLVTMLTHISPLAHNSGQAELFVLMSLLGMKTTLENGNSNATADVYSMYSIIYRGMTDDSVTADKWSKLALDVDEKYGGMLHGRVAFVRNWFINHWVRHMKESLPVSEYAAQAAFNSGDVIFGCFNLSCKVILLARTGAPLAEVIETGRVQLVANGKRVANAAFHLYDEIQRAKALAGLTKAYTSFTDEEFDEENDIASICASDFSNQIACYFISKLMINAEFGQWTDALQWAVKLPPFYMAFAGEPAEIDFEYFGAVAALYQSLHTDEQETEKLVQSADASLAKMRGWAQCCEANFLHKAMILEAIKEGMYGNADNALKTFEQAAAKAAGQGYIQHTGHAYEHMAHLQKRLGLPVTALSRCIEAYSSWGATGKINYMKELFM